MMKLIPIFLLAMIFHPTAKADSILSNQTPASCSNSDDCKLNDLQLTGRATYSIDGRSKELVLLGAGTRSEPVAGVLKDIYVAQLFGDQPSAFVRTADGVVASLSTQGSLMMRLTFIFPLVPNSTMVSKLLAGFQVNGVDTHSQQISELLSFVGTQGNLGTFPFTGSYLTFVAENASHTITIEGANGHKSIVGDENFVKQVFSLWLSPGKDENLKNLRDGILQTIPATNTTP